MLSTLLLPWLLLAPPADGVVVDEDVEVIEVRARRLRRDARDAALAIDGVDVDDDPRPATDVGALLDRLPGLRVVRTGDVGRTQTVQLRGAAGHQVAVMLDGLPLGGARGGAVDLGALPPGLVQRVEAVRGAAGAVYGSGAQGGVVHLRGRRATGWTARLRGGSFGLVQGDVAAGGAVGPADGRLAFAGSRSDGDFEYVDAQGRDGVRLNNDHQRLGGLLRGGLRLGATELGAVAMGAWAERGEPGRDQFPDPDARTAQDDALVALTGAGDLFEARLSWRAAAWGARRAVRFTDPTPLAADPARSDMVDLTVGARASVAWEDLEGHRPHLAVEARADDAETTGDAVFGGARVAGAATLGWQVDAVDALALVAALRADARTGRAVLWVPKAGAVWSPVEALTLRTNIGRLFRDPGLDELYFVGQGIRGDPDLGWEDGWGGDVGVTVSSGAAFDGVDLVLDAMGFAQRYDPIILFVPLDAYRIQASDANRAAVDGVELALRVAMPWVAFEGTWMAQRARFTGALEAPLPYRPAHRLFGLVRAPVGPVEPFVAARWQSAVSIDRFGGRTQAGYGLVDVGLAAALPWGFSVRAELRNVAATQAVDVLQRPLPGRSVVVELGWAE